MSRLASRTMLCSLALLGTLLSAPLLAAPILTLPQQVSVETGRPGGIKTISTASLPKTFNPYLAAETSSTDITGQMFLGLVTTNPLTTAIEPALAESWTISPDKKTYTFKLRKGLKWSDGKPISADDVVFTYKEIIDNTNIPNNYRDGLLIDDSYPIIKKIDELSVSFTTPRPFVAFLRGLSDPIMPRHVFAGKTQANADGEVPYNEMWGRGTPPGQLVVNGPWKLSRFEAGKQVELVRNPHFHLRDAKGQALPYLDKLIVLQVEELNEELAAFNAGRTDAITLRPGDIAKITRKDAKIYNLGPATGTLFVMFNQSTALGEGGKPVVDPVRSAWFRNKAFRQALAHALDKQSMVRDLYQGQAQPQFSHISQTSPFYHAGVRQYAYNLKTAQDLLAAAGFKKNAKGELLDPKGNRVSFRLVTNQGNTQRDAACKIIRRDWEKLGIQVDYQTRQFNLMVQEIDQTLDWDAMMIGLTGSAIEPHFGINSWKLDGRMHLFNMGHESDWKGRKGTSFEPWEKEVLEIYEKAAVEFDPEKRKQLYFRSQEIVAENLPFLYTVNSQTLVAVSGRLGNVFPSIHGGYGVNTYQWNTEWQFVR